MYAMGIVATTLCVLGLLGAEPAGPAEPVAKPQPVEAFNRYIGEALGHRKAQRHAEAVVALDGALAAIRDESGEGFDKARSRAQFYKALSLVDLRRFDQAEVLLALLVASPGLEPSERQIVRKRLATVKQLRRIELANRPGEVTVEALDARGSPLTKATVTIDGQPAPAPPFTVKLAPGRHVVTMVHAGLQPERQVVIVKAGGAIRLVLRPRPPTSWKPPVEALAMGGAALGLAAIGGLLHGLAAGDYNAAADKALIWQEANRLTERGDDEALSAYILYGTAGAVLVGAAIWLVVDAANHDGAPSVTGGVSVGRGGAAAIHLGGSF